MLRVRGQIMFCLLVSRGSVQVSEWYLLSGVPNQVLNRPSSGLKDACNRTRQNHTQPEGHFDIRSAGSLTLTFEPAAPKVLEISPDPRWESQAAVWGKLEEQYQSSPQGKALGSKPTAGRCKTQKAGSKVWLVVLVMEVGFPRQICLRLRCIATIFTQIRGTEYFLTKKNHV